MHWRRAVDLLLASFSKKNFLGYEKYELSELFDTEIRDYRSTPSFFACWNHGMM